MRLLAPQPRHQSLPSDAVAEPLSFETVFRSYARLVGRWAQRLGGPGVEADETVQQVFLTVNRRLPAFRGGEKVTSWLFQITARVVANQRRTVRRGRSRWGELSSQVADQAMSTAPGPAEIFEAREAAERFYRVLDTLRENHRHVLVLFELEEMSTGEIAALLEIPGGTVASHLRRAREAFENHVTRFRARRTGRGTP